MAAPLRPALAALKAYQAEAPEGDAALDANENPFAPPATFMAKALQRAAGTAFNRYPDPAASGLRRRLAARHRLQPEALLFGNGSDELIALLLTAFGGPGALAMAPSPTFSMYRLCALASGWEFHEEPLDVDFDLDERFVQAVKERRPRLVFLASPNNPTGRAFSPEKVDALRGLEGTTLVLDEAYAEFGGRSLLAEAAQEDGLVVLRTFSKAWGLAGLRLGWLSARPDLVAELEKLRLPYNLNALTQACAEEALDQAPAFLGRVPELLALRGRLEAALDRVPKLRRWASDANFSLIHHPRCGDLHAALRAAGLRVRRFDGGRLDACLRISVGDPEQIGRVERVLNAFAAAQEPA
jgi:histidinol-phosphate aminotransferase